MPLATVNFHASLHKTVGYVDVLSNGKSGEERERAIEILAVDKTTPEGRAEVSKYFGYETEWKKKEEEAVEEKWTPTEIQYEFDTLHWDTQYKSKEGEMTMLVYFLEGQNRAHSCMAVCSGSRFDTDQPRIEEGSLSIDHIKNAGLEFEDDMKGQEQRVKLGCEKAKSDALLLKADKILGRTPEERKKCESEGTDQPLLARLRTSLYVMKPLDEIKTKLGENEEPSAEMLSEMLRKQSMASVRSNELCNKRTGFNAAAFAVGDIDRPLETTKQSEIGPNTKKWHDGGQTKEMAIDWPTRAIRDWKTKGKGEKNASEPKTEAEYKASRPDWDLLNTREFAKYRTDPSNGSSKDNFLDRLGFETFKFDREQTQDPRHGHHKSTTSTNLTNPPFVNTLEGIAVEKGRNKKTELVTTQVLNSLLNIPAILSAMHDFPRELPKDACQMESMLLKYFVEPGQGGDVRLGQVKKFYPVDSTDRDLLHLQHYKEAFTLWVNFLFNSAVAFEKDASRLVNALGTLADTSRGVNEQVALHMIGMCHIKKGGDPNRLPNFLLACFLLQRSTSTTSTFWYKSRKNFCQSQTVTIAWKRTKWPRISLIGLTSSTCRTRIRC